MSWHFSRALVEEYLEENSSGGELFAQLSTNPMPQLYSQCDRMTAFCQRSQYGMMCEHLTGSHGEELLTWFLGDFHAKTSAVQEKEKALPGPDPGYGQKWHELSVKYDLNTYSLKTHRCLWEEDLHWSSVRLPEWGMMHNGVFLELMTAEQGTIEKDVGYWPTPLKNEGPGWSHKKLTDAVAIAEGYKPRYYQVPELENREAFTGKVNPDWAEWLMGWPMGWTCVSVELEMAKFQQWLEQHGKS